MSSCFHPTVLSFLLSPDIPLLLSSFLFDRLPHPLPPLLAQGCLAATVWSVHLVASNSMHVSLQKKTCPWTCDHMSTVAMTACVPLLFIIEHIAIGGLLDIVFSQVFFKYEQTGLLYVNKAKCVCFCMTYTKQPIQQPTCVAALQMFLFC